MLTNSHRSLISLCLLGLAVGAGAQDDVNCTKCVDTNDLAYRAVTTGKIDQRAVTAGKLAKDAVVTTKIKDGAVTLRKVSSELKNAIGTYCAPGMTVIGIDPDGHLACEPTSGGPIELQVSSAIPLASEARYLFTRFYELNQVNPIDNAAARALPANEMQNNFISSVGIAGNKVVATFGNNADASILGDTLEFVANVAGDSVYFTCNPTGNVVNYIDPASCVLIDEPPEPLTTIREQVRSVNQAASEARWLVEDFFRTLGYFPGNNNDASLPAPPGFLNPYASSLTVSGGGEVTVLFGNDAHPVLSGDTLVFTPTAFAENVSWLCDSQTIEDRYLGERWCEPTVDVPPKPVTEIWAQIQSGLDLAADVQLAVEDYYQSNGVWPISNLDAGLEPPAFYSTRYVTSISVGLFGVITIEYGADAHPLIIGLQQPISLTPFDNLAVIVWDCAGGPVDRYNVYECR